LRRLARFLQLFTQSSLLLVLFFCWVWGGAALFFAGPDPYWLRVLLVCIFGAFLPGIFVFSRAFYRAIFCCCGLFILLLFWWQTLQPTNDKDWAPDVAQISHGTILSDTLTMYNVRNFDYVDESTPVQKWETRTYDLRNLKGIDLFLSYWASEHIAHTILSWDFGEDGHLAISIETRKDKTQEYSAVKGFFKQFALSYVAADESDIIRLRTNVWKERVYLYRLLATKEQARAMLEAYLDEMNRLVDEPKFYNALTRNCTTTIRIHANAVRKDAPPPIDWRLILSGHVDELLFDRGGVESKIPFAELRQVSRIDLAMQEKSDTDFSTILSKWRDQAMNK
jgi:hypothetical protein